MSTHTKRNARLIAFLVVIIIVAFGLTVADINAQDNAATVKKPTIAAQKKAVLAAYLAVDSLCLKNTQYAATVVDTCAAGKPAYKVYKGDDRECLTFGEAVANPPAGWTICRAK